MKPQGIARTDVEIVDLSVLIDTGLKGITAVIGPTERGEIGKPRLIGSPIEYDRYFGGLLSTSTFPLLCKRALEAGAKLLISRASHYDDVSDANTLEATKGTLAVETTIIFDAANEGPWSSNLKVEVATPLNGLADTFDVKVTFAGNSELDYEVLNVPKTMSAEVIDTFNAASNLVKIRSTSTGDLAVTAATALSAGTDAVADIVNVDYTGDAAAKTGIHSFDNNAEFSKIHIPTKSDPALDIALVAYAEDRGDCMAVTRTPVGVDGATAIEYREGTGTYSHAAINSWHALMFTGGLRITHPITGIETEIPETPDVLGNFSRKDNSAGEWFSFSGPKRGRIGNALGVVNNLGSPSQRVTADAVDAHGINAVIEHPTFGVVSWGKSTLWKQNTLLKHAEVAELIIFLRKAIKPIVESELFEPNDIQTWKNIHRKVEPFMEYLVTQRAIWGYLYQGDQDIDNIEDAVINSTANIDQGQYIFHLFVKPKVALKYAGIKIAISNSGVSFDTLADLQL